MNPQTASEIGRALLLSIVAVLMLFVFGAGIPVAVIAEFLLWHAVPKDSQGTLRAAKKWAGVAACLDGISSVGLVLSWFHFADLDQGLISQMSQSGGWLLVGFHAWGSAAFFLALEDIAEATNDDLSHAMGLGDRYRERSISLFMFLLGCAWWFFPLFAMGTFLLLRVVLVISLVGVRRAVVKMVPSEMAAPPSWMRIVGIVEIGLGLAAVVGVTAWLAQEWAGWGYHDGDRAVVPPIVASVVTCIAAFVGYLGFSHLRRKRVRFLWSLLWAAGLTAAYVAICHLPASVYWRSKEAHQWEAVQSDPGHLRAYYFGIPGHLWRADAVERLIDHSVRPDSNADWSVSAKRLQEVVQRFHPNDPDFRSVLDRLKNVDSSAAASSAVKK